MTVAPATMRVPYAYLDRAFADLQPYLDDIAALAKSGDFTLGAAVREFEAKAATASGIPYAVGMANGTDALTLSLRALGIGVGDEVITATNSFVASAGAIAMTGATPVLVDVLDDFTIDPDAIERAITPRTAALLPVHLTGTIAAMPRVIEIAGAYQLHVVEDAAQAFGATLNGKHAGSWGMAAGVSLHPLKMLNVWGDGGLVLTRHDQFRDHLNLLRNHGLETRDDAVMFGGNGRLSSLQAVIANRQIDRLPWMLERRRANAAFLNRELRDLAPYVLTPVHGAGVTPTYQTYILRCERRDDLKAYLLDRGIDVKVHYPQPIHLQTVGRHLGYEVGDCPVAERQAEQILTLPQHEYLTEDDLGYMVEQIRSFYR